MRLADLCPVLVNPKAKKFKMGIGFIAQCPSCARNGRDQTGKNHLAIWEGDDNWIHFACQVKCSEDDIQRALGITQEDRRMDARAENEDPCYLYTDANGQYRFEKQRFYTKDGRKSFYQFCRSKGGIPLAKVPTKSGNSTRYPSPVEAEAETNLLYRLPAIRRAASEGKTIYINEGEKASDLIGKHGGEGTCQPHGAGPGKWLPQYTECLKGASEVVIVADLDEGGEEYASEVYAAVSGEGIPCRIVQSLTGKAKDDAYDHLLAGHALDQFVRRIDLEKDDLGIEVFGSNFTPPEVKFIVEPYLPLGKCVLFDADGGVGKTGMAIAWAAALSRGVHPLTFQPLPGGPVKILYLHKGEDGSDELELVYRANGGVVSNIGYWGKDLFFDEAGVDRLRRAILKMQAKLIIVDALFYFLPRVGKDTSTNDNMVAIAVMERLNRLAAQLNVSFFNIRHTSKGAVGKLASELGLGSSAFRNSHRGQLVARKHPDQINHYGAVIVTDEKGSLLVRKGEYFCYRRVDLEVQYIRNMPNPFGDTAKPTAQKGEDANEFLRRILAGGKRVVSHEVYQGAEAIGISKRTLDRAIKELGVKSQKMNADGGWYKYLPYEESASPELDYADEDRYDPFADE